MNLLLALPAALLKLPKPPETGLAGNLQTEHEIRIKIQITFIFRFYSRCIQLVVFVPVGLSSFLQHLQQVLLGVEVSSVVRPGQLTFVVQITDFFFLSW